MEQPSDSLEQTDQQQNNNPVTQLGEKQDSDMKEQVENPQPKTEFDSHIHTNPVHFDADEERSYYEEYCKLYCTSMIMAQKIKDLLMEGCSLQNCIERINCEKKKYETMMIPGMFIPSDKNGKQLVRMIAKPKRHRRTKGEIQRKFRCSTKGCSKSYGSEGSLNQHIKLKHPESWANIINAGKIKKL